jgi:hypothetical protein
VLQAPHQRIETLGVSCALSKLRKPLAECLVQRSALASGDQARPLDQVLVGAQGDILHTKTVYTILVRLARLALSFTVKESASSSALPETKPPRRSPGLEILIQIGCLNRLRKKA